MTETYCTLCQAPFSGAQAAKEHFAGKRHLKNLEKLRMMSPSTRDVLESKSLQSVQHEVRPFADVDTNSVSTSFCDLCKAPFSSVEAAGQRYAGKRHKKMLEKQQILPTIENNVSRTVTRTATTQSTQLEGLNQLEQRSTSASDVILSSVSTQQDKTTFSKASSKTDHLTPLEKTVPTTLGQQSLSTGAHGVDPNAHGVDPNAHGVDPYAVGGPSAHGVDSYAVGGPSAHDVDSYAGGGSCVNGVDTYAVMGPSANDVDAYAVAGSRVHSVDTQDIGGPSAHGVDTYTIGGPSEHGVDTYAVRGADDSGSSVLLQSVCEEDAYFCKLCLMPLSGPVPAKQHYSGRTHRKRSQALHLACVLEKSDQDSRTPDLESSRKQVEKTAHGNTTIPSQDVQLKTTLCDLCNVPLSGPQQAMQHYAGRSHRRKVDLQRNELSPKTLLSRQPQPTDAPLSIFTTVLMCDGVQEETKKRHGEIKEPDITDKTLLSSAIVEGKCAPISEQSSYTEINQSERIVASEGQRDQSERRSTPGGQMDQSERGSASQDQPSSLTVTSSPMVSLQTPASSEAPFSRSECHVYSRSVSTPANLTPEHKLQPRRMLSTSRLACNFQTQMAPPNTMETRNYAGTLRAGYTVINDTLNSQQSSPTVCEENVAQSMTVSPFVSEQSSVPVQALGLLVVNDNPCEKTSLKTPKNTEDLNAIETLRPGISAMYEHTNSEGDTTIYDQRFEYQRPQKGNAAIVSDTVIADSSIGPGLNVPMSLSEQIANNCREMKGARRKIEDFLSSMPDCGGQRAPPSDRYSTTTTTTQREAPPTHEPAQYTTKTTTPAEALFYCSICKLSVSGPKPLSDHNNGAKHKKKLKILGLFSPENTSKSSEYKSNGPIAMGCGNMSTPLHDNMTSIGSELHNRNFMSTSMFSSMGHMKQLSENIARTAKEKEELLSDVAVIPCSEPVNLK